MAALVPLRAEVEGWAPRPVAAVVRGLAPVEVVGQELEQVAELESEWVMGPAAAQRARAELQVLEVVPRERLEPGQVEQVRLARPEPLPLLARLAQAQAEHRPAGPVGRPGEEYLRDRLVYYLPFCFSFANL